MESGLVPSEGSGKAPAAASPPVPPPREPTELEDLRSEIGNELKQLRKYVFYLILRFGWSREDAEDIAQNVFVRYCRARMEPDFKFTVNDGGKSLVRTMVLRAHADFARSKGRHPEIPTDVFKDVPQDDPAFEELEDLNSIKQILREHLSAEQYKAVLLRHFDELDMEVIATELNTHRKKVAALLKEAAEILQKVIRPDA